MFFHNWCVLRESNISYSARLTVLGHVVLANLSVSYVNEMHDHEGLGKHGLKTRQERREKQNFA